VLMTDMRLLGWGMRKRSIADVVDQFRVPKRWGLLLIVICGILMAALKRKNITTTRFSDQADSARRRVVHELVFRRSVYADPRRLTGVKSPWSANWPRRFRCFFGRPSLVAGGVSAISSRRSIRFTPRSFRAKCRAGRPAPAKSAKRTGPLKCCFFKPTPLRTR